jgi:hypothetical protein
MKRERPLEIYALSKRIASLEKQVSQLKCDHPMEDRRLERHNAWDGIHLSFREVCGVCGKVLKEAPIWGNPDARERVEDIHRTFYEQKAQWYGERAKYLGSTIIVSLSPAKEEENQN